MNATASSLAALLAGSVLSLTAPPIRAEPIPIEEEFVFAQQVHADASLDMLVMQLLGDGVPVPPGDTLHYQGRYDIVETAPGTYVGSYEGVLSGSFLGEAWSHTLRGDMAMDAAANMTWTLDSSGEWKKGPYAGKKFKDKGKLVEKPDQKADLELEIETEGVEQKIKTTATDLEKVNGGGKLKVSGNIDVTDDKGKKTTEKLSIELDQATKTFTSQLTSPWGPFDVVVLKNKGSFTVVKEQAHYRGDTGFELTVAAVPEPGAMPAALGGLIVALGASRARARRRHVGRVNRRPVPSAGDAHLGLTCRRPAPVP